MPGNVKTELIAQLEPQRAGQTFFHTQAVWLLRRPAARHHRVMRRQLVGVREIELALHQTLSPVVRVVLRRHRRAVDGHQAAPDHGVPVVPLHAGLAQGLLKGWPLLGLDVNHKTVGRVGRRGLLPAANQIGAQEHEQDQRQHAHRQRTDLHHRISRPRSHLAGGQHQPARGAALPNTHAQQPNGQGTDQGKKQHRTGKATDRNQAQLEVAADGQQQGGKPADPQEQHRARGGAQIAHVAPDHPQRRHLRQLQNRWQAKGQHQGQAHAQPQQGGHDTRCRQLRLDQAGEQEHEHMVHRIADQHPQATGQQTHQKKLKGIGQRHAALALTKHPQHGTAIEVTGRKAARHDCHRHRTEQGRQQRYKAEKLARPVQGLPHLRPAAVERFKPHATQALGFNLGLGPTLVVTHRRIGTSHSQTVIEAAGRLDQAGGSHVGLIDHHPR